MADEDKRIDDERRDEPHPDDRDAGRDERRRDDDRDRGRYSDDERRRSRSRSRSPRRSRSRSPRRSRSRSPRRRYSRSPPRRRYSRSPPRRFGDKRARQHERENPEPSHVLGVFGLSRDTDERELERVFDRYGRLEKVTIVYDRQTGRSRGFGFVTFESVDDASAARAETTGMDIDGRRVRVDFSVTKRPHTPTPGQYMGDTGSRRPRSYRRSRSPPRRYRSRSRSPRRDY